MRHRYISYFAGIFLLAFFAVLNTGVLISVSGFQRLQKPVVSQPDFRRQPVSETHAGLFETGCRSGTGRGTLLDGNRL